MMSAPLTIDRNKILGEGAYAMVYEGIYGGAQVAVKTFKRIATRDKELLDHIQKESTLRSILRHPNIVSFWGRGIDPITSDPCFIFERWGGSIYDTIRNEPPPPMSLRHTWLLDIAHALDYLHQQDPPIIHRDLKPDNIVIGLNDQRAVLADFGMNTIFSTHSSYSKELRQLHFFYTPPEAHQRGYRVTTEYDIFSFGMTMYYICTRHLPFEGETMIESKLCVSQWIHSGDRPPRNGTPYYERRVDSVADACWDLIERCWGQDPNNRPSWTKIIQALEELQNPAMQDATISTPPLTEEIKTLSIYQNSTASASHKFGNDTNASDALNQESTLTQKNTAVTVDELFENVEEWLLEHNFNRKSNEDLAETVMSFQMAADKGCAVAQYNLALCYLNGRGVDKSIAKAVEWYHKSADQGFAAAQYNLALFYLDTAPSNLIEGMKWLQVAASQEYVYAQYRLAWQYNEGQGIELNKEEAFKWFCKAAEQGHLEAMFMLGLRYSDGDGVEKDLARGVTWFQMAAEKGYDQAQASLGLAYMTGVGVPLDVKKAEFWLRKSVVQSNERASHYLGLLLANAPN
ncbi:kinase-like protein [Rhizoclosmatium globosum]|uniref:Kinase-like protein n=1 Tax=Rhizoclosmatium globosum TaxID=329046 RepID=A0A1Y2BE00_9FUNG|nr:kinase-like protein [Rhizoclosmatium globosum]|eukprot:ORY32717.1 kinase-like protein [Rhizoclosmatium globosum]